MKRQFFFFYAVLLLAMIFLVPSLSKAADSTAEDTDTPVEPTNHGNDRLDAKAVGITGGIIAGAEAVIAVEAAVGADKLWPYLVFPPLGAAGGGVGGYFLEKASAPGAVALLVTGIAMIIPTAILTASAFSYDPEKDGAVKSDTMEGGNYSFEVPLEELPPTENKEEKAVTDVEMQPEVGPPADAAPSEATPSEGVEEAPADPTGDNAPKPDETAPASADKGAGPSAKKTNQSKTRRASNSVPYGTLLHLNREGALSMSVPYIDIRPLSMLTDDLRADGTLRRPEGVEVHIPLLCVDLP